MSWIRPPAVAGMFYPGQADQLQRQLDDMFIHTDDPVHPWRAALVPHAGWVYSGRIAAAVLRRIRFPARVIILCPKHHPGGSEWAVAPYDRWEFPGGRIQSDRPLAERLAKEIAGWHLDERPHIREHAIEVQLPLLARAAPNARVVGVTIGRCDLASCQQFADGLTRVLQECDEPILLIVSSDMNHFATDAENRRLDELAMQALQRLEPAELYETCLENRISMCGMRPAVIVLETLRRLDALHRCQRVGYATSAEASGDKSRVVGYAGMLFD